eukprot:NODE_864_length_741_cov_464.978324_g663_i0.p1 GENE.NODE_864_length_741_cov_464.978324_g663_i0~~NODE_864_length_741_cov_464.978324_g663_i0.p1  ORF type:complete len:190 (+),score=26.98 NODE_864_length_741_cov_464.978324_g663_i0:44-613(+)
MAERNPITTRMDYYGPVVNKAARVQSVAAGGQIAVSRAAYGSINQSLQDDMENDDPRIIFGIELRTLGKQPLKGIKKPERVYTLVPRFCDARVFPPINGVQPKTCDGGHGDDGSETTVNWNPDLARRASQKLMASASQKAIDAPAGSPAGTKAEKYKLPNEPDEPSAKVESSPDNAKSPSNVVLMKPKR